MAEQHIISTAKDDDLYYNTLKIQFLRKSYQTSHLSLTILPTQACNLRCPYCFEGEKMAISMTEEIQEALIKFILGQPIKSYSITWFGGEPLLRSDIILSILDKLSSYSELKLNYHSIITNGTLFNDGIQMIFQKYPLDSIQITLDGRKEIHDLLRQDSHGKGTYELIKRNIASFSSTFPHTHMSIRLNVKKDNANDFTELYRTISSWFKASSSKYNIYPGMLKEVDGNIVDGGCLSRGEQQEFYLDLQSKGIYFHGLPKNEIGGCTATTAMSMVIGANGKIYKCWEDVGKDELAVGSLIHQDLNRDEVLVEYLLNGSKFSSDDCRKCGYLPICNGGCPKDRIFGQEVIPTNVLFIL